MVYSVRIPVFKGVIILRNSENLYNWFFEGYSVITF